MCAPGTPRIQPSAHLNSSSGNKYALPEEGDEIELTHLGKSLAEAEGLGQVCSVPGTAEGRAWAVHDLILVRSLVQCLAS